jgi:hypothetical protein
VLVQRTGHLEIVEDVGGVGKILKFGCLGIAGLVGLLVVGVVIIAIAAPAPSDKDMQKLKDAGKQEAPQKPQEPQGPEDYLEVTGTPGIPFSCSVMHGDMRQTTVDGTVPQKIKLENMHDFGAVSENQCQKSGSKGTLKVVLYVGGDLKAENSTSAAYGIASVGYPD